MNSQSEPASFAFLAGQTTHAEYHTRRNPMFRAKNVIVEILLVAKRRLAKSGLGSVGAFRILHNMLTEYYKEWTGGAR